MSVHINKHIKQAKVLVGGAALMLAPVLADAQIPNVQWQRVLGGIMADSLTAVEPTEVDGGFIVGGYSRSPQSGDKKEDALGGTDYWILKLDSKGEPEWQLTLGGTEDDFLQSIKPVKGGERGYIVGGYSYSSAGGEKTGTSRGGADYWIVKLDAKGGIEWERTIGGNADDILSVVYPDPDGNGYIAGGWSHSGVSHEKTQPVKGGPDFWVVKITSDGSIIEWDATFGGAGGSSFLTDITFFKGNYILGGYSNANDGHDKSQPSVGGYDYWVVSVDAGGAFQWDVTIGGDGHDYLAAILTDENNGGYILAGSSGSDKSGDRTEGSRGGFDYWVVRTKDDGAVAYDIAFGSDLDDILTSARAVADGKEGYILGGWSNGDKSGEKSSDSYGGTADYWFVKMDENDKFAWDLTIGGKSGDDVLKAIVPTQDGGFIAGGTSLSDKDGEKTEGSQGDADYWLIKYQGCEPTSSSVNASFCAGTNYRLPDGAMVSTPGTYMSLVTGPSGCLDTVYTVLTQLPRYSFTISDTICQGSTYRLPDGREVSIGGVYAIGFRSIDGCDSMYTVNLSVKAPDTTYVAAGICNGEAHILPGGRKVYRPGVYTDLVSTPGSCDTVVITTLDVSFVDASVSQTGNTLQANATDLDSYQWINCATLQPVEGATNASFTPANPGFYAVAVMLNGCPDTSACFPIGMKGLDIEHLVRSTTLRLYPNPAFDQLTIESTDANIISSISIYNMMGAIVYQAEPNTPSHRIATSRFGSGVYMVRVHTNNGIQIERIEVSR